MSKHRLTRSVAPLLLWLLLAVSAQTDTATVAPGRDNTTDSWTTTPLWSKINEDIDSPNGTAITSPSNPTSPGDNIVFTITCPGNVQTITEANLRVRANKAQDGARSVHLQAHWSATPSTDFEVVFIPTTMANYASGNKTGLSISKATCDSSTIEIDPSNSGTGSGSKIGIDTYNLDITYTPTGGGPPRSRSVVIQ